VLHFLLFSLLQALFVFIELTALFVFIIFNQVQELVELECKDWASKNINIKYEIRESRKGYKAGALKKGMEHSYAQECDFIAIFDADFQPEPDFLLRTVPFLVHNPKIALVQTRWEFGEHACVSFTFYNARLHRVHFFSYCEH
jgi:cellulose synthase/poly-beta-1,6-N-acetylglucosamine synthase-like glycosyltransferase